MAELRKHVVKVHSVKFYNCVYCSLKFSSKVILRNHLRNHTNDIKISGQIITSKKILAQVLLLNATMCNICKVKHYKTRHTKSCNYQKCTVTLKRMSTKRLACDNKSCKLIFSSPMALKSHKARNHSRKRDV